MAAVLLICAGWLCALPPDSTDYQAAARAARDAGAHLKLAVWCEANGFDAERLKHLAAALAIDPRNAAARGMMGLVSHAGRWLSPEKVAEAVNADESLAAKLAEYEAKRESAPVSADGQWQLGLWCEKNGLKPEATAHFSAVTQIAPRRTEAWHKLGCELYHGRWLNADQLAAKRIDDEAQKKADRYWEPILGSWKKELVFDNPKRDRAIATLKEITDPRAVPSIQRTFGHGNRAQQEMAVAMLDGIDCPASSHALAALSLFDRWPEVRTVAIEGLRRRDPRDYMDAMIGLMRHPLKYEVSPVGPSGEAGVLIVEGDRSRTRLVYPVPQLLTANPSGVGYVAIDDRGSTRVIGPNSAWHLRQFLSQSPSEQFRELALLDQQAADVVGRVRRSTERTLQRDLAVVQQLNRRVEAANQRIGSTLMRITGESSPGYDPDAWMGWWTDKLGLKYERTESRYKTTTTRVVPTPIIFQVHHSCFVAGTPISTLTGLRPIESLKVGDLVLTQDTSTGALDYQPIVGVHHNPPAETVRIRLKQETIVCTPVHRFWCPGRGWRMARDLKPGDLVRSVGARAEVLEITPDPVQPVFNLDVTQNHSFFVGSGRLLVRDNSLPPPMLTPFDAEPSLAAIARPPSAPSAVRDGERPRTRAGDGLSRPESPRSSPGTSSSPRRSSMLGSQRVEPADRSPR